ncbi:MAG TPA: methyltransferase [Kouleothrix sp.]|uniref:class I SAM-dependent methyltransferase n=1 Tax=Kouleothrix sp. TaxID=2779161 RepID=UPI002CBAFDFB|nr:methyltransferase [Kouleothrix sp.]HRC75334.1 methyltransferase [Kouleothrix sp.]
MDDVYFKKRIDYYCRSQSFAFDVAHTLFSSHQIDDGTDLFLRTIELATPRTILDMGCGCGVIGIVLARLLPAARVYAIDRDLLAIRYTRHNAELNHIANLEAIGSVGLEHAPREPYDLIVANIPAKIGDEAIEREFVRDPYDRLRPGGDYWFVVVSGLNHLIPGIGVRSQIRLRQVKKRAGHAVYHVRKPATGTDS